MLQRIQRAYPEALIAGGCLRDLHFNKPISDIDIFVNGSYHSAGYFRSLIEQSSNQSVIWDRTTKHNNVIYQKTIGKIVCFGFEGEKYQVVQKGHNVWSKSINDTFDIGLCMLNWDGIDYCISPHFVIDAAYRRLTLVNSKEHSSLGHQARVRNKYPEFEWRQEADTALVNAYRSLGG